MRLRHLVIIVSAALACYANTLFNDFTYDDAPAILLNPRVTQSGQVKEIFTKPSWFPMQGETAYRPLTTLSFHGSYGLFGPKPLPFHLQNIFLHAAVCLLIYFLVLRLGLEDKTALWSAMLFALHPLHTEAVAAVVNRTELMSALFVLGALLLHLKGSRKWAALSFLAGLFCKENAVVFLALAPALDWAVSKEKKFPYKAARYWPYGAAFLFYMGARSLALKGAGLPSSVIEPTFNPLVELNPFSRFLNAARLNLGYLWLLLFPVKLSADYSYNQLPLQSVFSVFNLLSACVWAALVWVWVRLSKIHGPLFAFIGALFLISFLPVSNWIIPSGTIFAERLMYLPSLAFCLALAYCVWKYIPRQAVWVMGALCMLYATRAFARNLDWKNNLILFESMAKSSPDSMKAQGNYGNALLESGKIPEALVVLQKARAINPEKASEEILSGLGSCYLATGNEKEAEPIFLQALRVNPDYANALFSLGVIYLRHQDFSRALFYFKETVRVFPQSPIPWFHLGLTLEGMRNKEAAREVYGYALKADANYAPARQRLEALDRK